MLHKYNDLFGGIEMASSSLVLVVLVVVLAVLLLGLGKDILGMFRKKGKQEDKGDALQILKARLARGEISIEEYNTLRKQLVR